VRETKGNVKGQSRLRCEILRADGLCFWRVLIGEPQNAGSAEPTAEELHHEAFKPGTQTQLDQILNTLTAMR